MRNSELVSVVSSGHIEQDELSETGIGVTRALVVSLLRQEQLRCAAGGGTQATLSCGESGQGRLFLKRVVEDERERE